VWQRVAQILPARIATEVIDGRPPDMSPAAARAIIEETRRNA